MPGRGTHELRCVGVGRTEVHGKFRPNGTSALAAANTKGRGFSVARTSQGLYTVTFDQAYPELLAFSVGLRDASAVGAQVNFGDYSAANKTLQIRTFTDSGGGIGTIPLDITALREIVSNEIAALDDTEATTGRTSTGLLASDSTPLLKRVNTSTDKALRVAWAASDVTELQFPAVPKPADLDASSDMTVHLMAKMAGSTDTPTVDIQVFDGEGDTEMGGATGALGSTLAEVSTTIANANIAAAPGFFNISLVPGAHGTDILYLYAAWIEYVRAATLVDLASDADNEISFRAVFAESVSDY